MFAIETVLNVCRVEAWMPLYFRWNGSVIFQLCGLFSVKVFLLKQPWFWVDANKKAPRFEAKFSRGPRSTALYE